MSHFFGRRSLVSPDGYTGGGVTDHGALTGLYPDDDHPQYLITSAIRVVDSANSGISKTDVTAGDVFTITNAGTGAALFIKQTGTTTNADAAVDIDNSDNAGRGLSVFSTSTNPLLPLVQFSALDQSFDEPILLITHADPGGLALKVLGDGYISGHIFGPQSVQFTSLDFNPVEYGDTGIYIEGEPGTFYFVDKDGNKHTFGPYVTEGDGIDIKAYGNYREISVDANDIYGTGLGVETGPDGYLNLRLDASADLIYYNDTDNVFVVGNNVQEALDSIDGYLQSACNVPRIHKFGADAVDYPFNTAYTLDGYSYKAGENKLIVAINGIIQDSTIDYAEISNTVIQFSQPLDNEDELDIIVIPCGVSATGGGGSSDLQGAYDNSPSGAKDIFEDAGQITITQLASSGSVLRLISNSSLTTAFTVDQSGSGEAVRLKSNNNSGSTILIQKDASSRNTVINTVAIDRTTTHIAGGLTGIGSAILTRLESSGTNLFNASRLITGTESAADSIEDTFFAIELSDDGTLVEHLRLNSIGNLGLGTTTPSSFKLQVEGDIGPNTDLQYNLGSPSKRWKDGYFGAGSLYLNTGKLFLGHANDLHFLHDNGTEIDLVQDYAEQYIDVDVSTVISNANEFVKVAGTTLDGYHTVEFNTSTSNRITYVGDITKKFMATAALCFHSTSNNHDVEFAIAKNGAIVDKSMLRINVSNSATHLSIAIHGIIEMQTNDFIEVFVSSEIGGVQIHVEHMNFSATQL